MLGVGPGAVVALATAQTLPFLLPSMPFGMWASRGSSGRPTVGAEFLCEASLLRPLASVLIE
jgi:hypothetical protein